MTKEFNVVTVRDAAILTTSYVVGNVIGSDYDKPRRVQEYNQLVLLVAFTIGSLTTAEIKVEYSDDGTTWYQDSFGSVSSGTNSVSLGVYQLSATGNYRIPIALKDRYVRVSVKGTGTVTSSSMAVKAVLGNV